MRRSYPGVSPRSAAIAAAALIRNAGGWGASSTIAAVVATLNVATATPKPPINTSALGARLTRGGPQGGNDIRRRALSR